jgi:predicted NAD-dependent protein-ADP-ribosyltransferase YbiA (DUF1768 family)
LSQRREWKPEFSNFHIEPDGSFVEREFQAAKYEGHPIRQAIVRRTATPRKAKKLGRLWRLTEDELVAWNERRVDIMVSLVDKKVEDWPYIEESLRRTDTVEIAEFNRHHDNFWGDCTCGRRACAEPGQNWLGETWMLIRRRLHEGGHDEYEAHWRASVPDAS